MIFWIITSLVVTLLAMLIDNQDLTTFSGTIFISLTAIAIIRSTITIDASVLEEYPNLSIVGIIALKKRRNSLTAGIIIIMAYIVNFTIGGLNLYILSAAIVFLAAENMIFEYRIRTGLYGKNEREAREIINFIIKEYQKIDFTDEGKRKPIISDSDLGEMKKAMKEMTAPITY
jgi:hypothetical protein